MSKSLYIVIATLSELALISTLAVAAHTDYKTQTVPCQLLPFLYPVLLLNTLANKPLMQIAFDLLGTTIVFLLFYLNARLLGGGGGDALLLPAIPLQHGLFAGLLIIMAGCLVNTCAYIVERVWHNESLMKHASMPIVPGVFLAYTLYLILFIRRFF